MVGEGHVLETGQLGRIHFERSSPNQQPRMPQIGQTTYRRVLTNELIQSRNPGFGQERRRKLLVDDQHIELRQELSQAVEQLVEVRVG